MNARPANRRLISRAALVLLALVALAILFVGAPTASADDPPQVPSADPPEAPHRLRVSPGGSGELAASWRAPHDDGGSPIIGYKVQWKSGSEHYDDSASSTRQAVITDPNRLGHTIRGLSNGTEYTVRVIATNSVGDGPPSLEESATTHPEPGDEPDGSRGGYGGDGVYTWWDGDREMRVRIEPDEDPQRYGGGEGEPVFRSDSGGGVMTLPGGVLLVLDPSWTGSEVKRFFSRNGIKASRVTELGFAENAYFVETEPGFPSLQLANTLAGEEGVVISSPNWTTEVTTDDGDENEDPVEDPGDTIGTAIDLTLDTKVNATISSYEDLDYYRFQLVESTVIWIHASLSSFTVLDTDGEEVLPEGNDGGFHRGKSVRRLGAGVYYLKFSHRTSCSTDINCLGPYYVQVNAISDQGDTIESATLLNVSPGYDIADSWNPAYSTVGDLPSESDVDFFKVELDAATEVVIRVDAQLVLDWFGFHNTVSLAVFDKDGNPLHPPGVGMSWNGDRSYSLNAGTYYFRLARLIQDWTSDKMWYYHVWFYENLEYTKFIEDCTGIETPFGDPLSGCQTHLGSSETGDLGINVQDVWETNKGEGIYVAVVDREVDYDHEDLRDNINRTLSHDYIEEDQLVLRLTGHGTSVAGLIAARDNELGVRGVAPRATIVGYNYLENGTLLNRADALTRNMDLVAVSNASFGKTGTGHPRPVSQTYTMALETGVSQGFGGKGTFYVHSAGNSHSYTSHVNLREQKNFYAVTTVCSVESDGTRADYSETGYALWVCAPIAKVTTENWNRYSDDFGGTSSAAPLVSGVAALIRSAHPSLTWRDVKLILAASAQHNDPDNASWREGALEYNSVTERYFYNPEYGFGVIDAEAALDLAESWTNLPPMKSTGADSGEIDLTIPDLTEDGDSTTVTRELFLNSDVGFTEFVEVTIDFDHPAFRDLDIEIESPSGTFSKLTVPSEKNGLRRSELYSTFRFGSAAHLGEDPSGVWTLRLADHAAGRKGKIAAWSIKVYGHGLGVAPPSILILPQDQDWHDVPESAAPRSPQDLVVIPGDGRLTVKWLPSDEEDSPPVTAYKVQWKRGAQGWDTPGDVFEGTVTHLANLVTGGGEYAVQVPALTNGVAYTVRVIAVTSTGDSRLGEIRRVIPGIPGVAAILQELCDRTEQVRDAVMARKSYIGDCSIVTNLHLETVRGLDLEDSGIEALLAEDFRGLSNLEWLALSANDLSELPEGVFDDLSSLERLTLSSNDLSALPEGVFDDLSSLERLTLSSNDLSALPEGVFDDLSSLEILDLSGNDLSALPEGVFDDLTNLKQLSLSHNDLSEWPESVFNDLSSLEWLSLHGNDLSELPEGALDGLTNMERLFLYQNALSKLPEGVFDKLSNLRVLYLWGNDLSALPEGVFDDLTNLESLALGANDLSALPEGVFDDLSSLELLTLARNGLSALPEGVFDDLSSLESLTLDGNDLSGLPDDLFDGLSGIRQLELHDNPGAPFTFTAELSQVAAVAVVVELAQAVPFDMVVTLSAQGGLLSTSTVTVDAGTSRSEQIRVTPDDEGPVTLTLVSAAFQSSAPAGGLNFQFEGIEAVLGQPLTLRDAKGDNTPATGLPTIVGTTRTGETLTAHTSGIHDADGWLTGATFSYQWIVNDTNADTEIQGATASSYTLVSADERKMIKVTVTFIDNGFNEESLTSEPTATVSPPKYTKVPDTPDTPTGTAVFIGGVDLEWNEVPEAESYEVRSFRNGLWIDLPGDGVEIAFYGAGAIISQLNHEGASYWFRVRAGNPLGYSEWSDYHWMEPTYTHDSGKQVRPGNVSPTGVPTIVGAAHVGETLTASASAIEDANGLGRVKFSYQWVSYNGTTNTDIRRATDAAYTLTTADQGKTIKVRVSFTDRGGYAESLTSAESQAVTNNDSASNTPATGLPTISGTAQVGETLTVNTSGIDDADGMSGAVFSYQWLANDAEITGATSDTYTLVDADFDKAVKVRVIFNDDDDNEETLTSEATAAVAAETAVPDAPQSLNVSPDDTGTLDVSWEAPSSDGGSPITGYKVQWKSGSEDYDGSAGSTRQAEITDPASRTHTITGLTDGVEYTVRVIAANDVGDSPPSDEATGTPRETTPPELSTATVDGTTLTLIYDEALDEASGLAADAFSVAVVGTGRAVDGVSVAGDTVTLTLASAVTAADTVTVSYTAPTDAAAPRIQDEAGNPAASFSDQDVENNTPPPANTPATGAPTISGTAQVGETLTAETRDIEDDDGLDNAVFTYQWLANGADIAGATSDTYTLVEADAGLTIKVKVSFFDDKNNPETLTSAATAAVQTHDPNSPPTVTGPTDVDYAENSVSSVATYIAMDPEGEAIKWSVSGTDHVLFSITSGVLELLAPPNYENPIDEGEDNGYLVDVTATDSSGAAVTIAVTVTVTDVYDPNIVLVMADEGGYELFGAYGSTQYRTPRIDEIAAASVRFTHAYSKPGSTPSRVALMTGKSNVRNYVDWGTLLPGEYTIADLFSDAGYATAIAGKWQLQGRPNYITGVAAEESGFDTYCLWYSDISERRYWQPTFECDGQVIDYAALVYGPDKLVDFLDEFIESNQDKPFFAYYSMLLPHAPFDALPPTAQCADADNAQCVFEDMVAYMDYNVGRIYDKLESLGLLDNTVFLFTSDNGTPESKVSRLDGEAIHGEKGEPTDGGTHVPLIVHAPGATGGQVIDDLIDFTDFLPTLADAAGLTLPADVTVDGQSFWDRLQGGSGNLREWIYTYYFPEPYTDRWNFPREHPEVAYVRNKTFKLYASGDLYDLSVDRHEVRPLAEDDEDSRAARAALQAVLDSMPEQGQEIVWDSVLTPPPATEPRPRWRPVLRSATVNGAELSLAYAGGLKTQAKPGSDAFSVEVEGTGRTVTSVSLTEEEVTLTLASAVTVGQTVTVSYTPPSEKPLRRKYESKGNKAAALTEEPVRNDTGLAPPTFTATGAPSIGGTAQVGETLTVDTSGIDDEDGLANVSFSYQWLANDAEIVGATDPTYTLVDDDAGLTIKVKVSFFDDENNPETLTSEATAAVAAAAPDPGPITGFTVVDASDQSVEGALADGGTLALDDPDGGSFGIRADLESGATIGSMRLQLTGEKTHDQTENIAPYSLYGDSGGNLSGESLPVGEYTLTATAYSEARLGGDLLGTLKVSFSVTETATQQPNSPATGLPTISGTARVGETLGADISGIDDADGLTNVSFSYQWLASDGITDTDLSGATGNTYTLVSADEGKIIKVTVSFTDDKNHQESLTSAATAAVEVAPNSPAAGAPIISGTAKVGETLTASTSGIADADGLTNVSFSYQWISSDGTTDTDISGATGNTHTLVAADVGKTIKVRVSFTDARNFQETLTSGATATVTAAVTPLTAEFEDAPDEHDGTGPFTFRIAFSEPISISYKTLRDDSLDVTNGSATKAKRVNGQSDLWEITVEPDSDADVTVVLPITEDCAAQGAVCTRAGGSEPRPLSNRSELTVPGPGVANSPATGAPTISGTVQVGQTLTASTTGIADADGLTNVSFSYQWLADDTEIAGATGGSYTLVADDQGKAIKVRVSFSDDDDNEETLTSVATAAVAPRPNIPATGLPTISGTAQVGETLTVDTSGISDANGLTGASFGYQWIASDGNANTEIQGATASTYTLVAADEGKTIKVRVSFTDDANNQETLTSVATAAVSAAPNSPATGLPAISGTAQVGETLTTDTSGISDANGLTSASFGYQWLSSDGNADTDISGATGDSYTLVDADEGKTIKVRVSFTDDDDNVETLTSEPTAAVQPKPNSPATGLPTINGTAQVGETLTASTSGIADADGLTNVSFSYQWLSSDGNADISGATGDSYTLVDADEGETIRVRVSFTDDRSHQETLTSGVTAAVAPRPNSPATGAPTISETAQVGKTLTAVTSGIADADGLTNVSFSYQWLADDTEIAGATDPTYTLVDGDAGLTIKVKVSFFDDKNNPETLTSAATAAVAPRPNSPATGAPTISGTVRVGETLTVDTSGIDDADGMSGAVFSYQWLANGADVAGATSDTYTLVADDVDKAIKVKVSFRDDKNNSETLTSAATAAVEPRPNSPATGAPSISGTVRVGETLTAETSAIADADGMSGAVFSYQWLANGADVAGATSDTYTPVADDVGKAIKVKVSFRDDRNHQESLTSAATAAVADDSSIWSATLTVGSIAGFRGFWKDVGMGELTSEVFTLDGVDYTVKALADSNGLLFELTLDKALPVGFTLQVGATTLSSQDASIREYSSGATQYGWANQEAILADVDTVEVSLTLAE